jgi:hypothetical protein
MSNKVFSTRDFERLSLKEAFELPGSRPNGLSDEEAKRRLSVYGEVNRVKMLITSIAGVIITFKLLGITELIIEPISVNAVLFSLAYSTIFTLSIDPIKVLMFKKIGLNS